MKIKDAKWEAIDNAIGMRPKFQVICTQCLFNYILKVMREGKTPAYALDEAMNLTEKGEFDMVLREAFCSPLPTIGEKAYHNDMHYKCAYSKGCDQIKIFGPPIDKEYYEWLMKKRDDKARIQPWEDWDKDPDIRKQLKGMGYI